MCIRDSSFNCTSAERVRMFDVTPVAISLMDFIEHGAINIPSVLKEPEAIAVSYTHLDVYKRQII